MLSVAMSRSLDGALGQAANEILAAEKIDQEGRYGADQHRAACDIVGMGVHLTGLQGDERGRYRLLAPAGENDAEQILVPDAGELPDDGDDKDRRGQGKNDFMKDAPEARAVDSRRFDEVVRDIDVVVATEERRERETLDHMDENQSVDCVRQVQGPEDKRPGQKRDLAG